MTERENPAWSPFAKGENDTGKNPLFGKEGQGEIFGN
jgi:hypothetical protein